MLRSLALATLVAGSLIAAPIPKKEDAKDYTGIKLGAKWTYSMTDDKEKAELVTEVQEDAIQKDKSRRIVLSQTLTVDKQVLPAKKETYRAADGFIELVDVNGKKASGGKIPLAIKPGDTLDVEVEFGEKQKMRVEVGVLEDVTVPAGKYKALPITVTIKEGEKTKVMSKMWVAENVGVVKMDSDGAVRELRAFTPGKDK